MKTSSGLGLLILGAPAAAAAASPHLGTAAPSEISFARVFLALFFCLVLAGLAIFLLRQRLGGRAPAWFGRMAQGNPRVRLVENRRIAPQSDLCLIECDGVDYLVLISPGGPLLIRERPAQPAGEA